MAPRTAQQFEQIRNERKAEILEAALHLFAEEGYHSASVSKLAGKAGISKGLMYNYFKSKEEVLKTLIIELFNEVTQAMDVKPGEVLTREKFIHTIEQSINIAVQNPQRWKLYMSLTFQPDVMPIVMEEMMPRVQPFVMSLVGYFASKGHEDPMASMRIFSAFLDGVQLQAIVQMEGFPFPMEKAKNYLIELFA